MCREWRSPQLWSVMSIDSAQVQKVSRPEIWLRGIENQSDAKVREVIHLCLIDER